MMSLAGHTYAATVSVSAYNLCSADVESLILLESSITAGSYSLSIHLCENPEVLMGEI